MIRSQILLPTLIACALGALAGCSKASPDAATPTHTAAPAARYVAVARGKVDVEAGLLSMDASVAGVVDRVDVHIGDHVKRGQTLATLHDEDARAAVTVARGSLEQARAQEKLTAAQLTAAKRLANTMAKAAAAGADSGQHATDAADRVAELNAHLEAAHAAVDVAKGHVQQAERALQLHTLYAPRDAEIVDVDTQPGETVSPQSGPLFQLLPDAPRIVMAELDSAFADRVHAGMQAEVVLDDDSAQSLGRARVIEVGQVFEASRLDDDAAQHGHARTVRCLLRFDKPVARRIGQRVLVRFLPDATSSRTP
ncbi:efflux RND transporter periplasmic adaptor subunit [Oleiagrimonas soli]|uniref:Multidrug resistance efflux pump n=1 Tax=Oleiagrimonas soli TaxID=1543381 RepID=A0A099CVU8_9GAMM|nr:HlyD family efflux transporter periplasmic adaptor subunit [Oleiagrimonas soli]KGI77757.1 hypothetical protein LF63_0104800 [Oleiagrimonas soli]MBB6183928.1 multidrug resistance efflux pump [Oleiagrimonas soli]